MVYFEIGYIRHYERNNKKEKRKIKTVEIRGIKPTTKFKDKQEILIIDKQEFKQMQQSHENELNQIRNELNEAKQEINNLNNQLNNLENKNNHETNQLNNKIIALLEMINNRNQLIINANDNLNYIIDNIIKELNEQYGILINDNSQIIKKNLETFLKSVFDNANGNNIILSNEIKRIEKELNEANEQLNNLSLWQMIRKRKEININIDLSNLKALETNLINYNDLNINYAIDNIINEPNLNELDIIDIKDNAKNRINFNDFYINLEHEKK